MVEKRPEPISWQAVLIATIAAIPPTMLAAASLWQATAAKDKAIEATAQAVETHQAVNSRMDRLLLLIEQGAADKATLAEKDAQTAREGAAAVEAAKPQVKK